MYSAIPVHCYCNKGGTLRTNSLKEPMPFPPSNDLGVRVYKIRSRLNKKIKQQICRKEPNFSVGLGVYYWKNKKINLKKTPLFLVGKIFCSKKQFKSSVFLVNLCILGCWLKQMDPFREKTTFFLSQGDKFMYIKKNCRIFADFFRRPIFCIISIFCTSKKKNAV